MIVRPARPEDEDALARLAADAFDHLPPELASLQVAARDADRAHRHPSADRLVVERDGTVVASALVDRTILPWVLVDLEVAAGARRGGVGRALVRDLLSDATVPVELEADPLRPAALAFWSAVGFVPVGPGSAQGAIRMGWSPPAAAR